MLRWKILRVFCVVPSTLLSGNERADRISNEAVETEDVNIFRKYAHDLSALPGSYLRESWDEFWAQDGSKGRHYRAIQTSIPIKVLETEIR